jgi:hypothetical protein
MRSKYFSISPLRCQKLFFALGLFLFIAFNSSAQSSDFLLLKRGNNTKSQIKYHVGEQITYKSAKLGYYVTDVIKEFTADYIYLSENIISPEDILEVDIRNKDRRNKTLGGLNYLLLGSGVLLFTVDGVNSLYQQGELTIDRNVSIISGILVGTGLALLPVRYKTFRHKGRNRIQIIQMRMN